MPGALGQMGIAALLSVAVAIMPAFFAAVYAIRPTEAKLALMRPLSLASIFGASGGTLAGVINVLRMAAMQDMPLGSKMPLLGLSESLVPLFVAFGALTVGWLLVALGLRRA